MAFKYKGKSHHSTGLFQQLIKDYGYCPECGSDEIGGTPSSGSIHYDGEHGTFSRGCKCGWKIEMELERAE